MRFLMTSTALLVKSGVVDADPPLARHPKPCLAMTAAQGLVTLGFADVVRKGGPPSHGLAGTVAEEPSLKSPIIQPKKATVSRPPRV